MEQTLSARFARAASVFGKGLASVIKGSILGVSLALISKLLNPLEAIEEKLKNLLGEGTDIRDLADRFNTSPGQLKQLQDVAQTLGVSPDQFKDMLTKYAQAIEKGREEIANPFQEPSQSTIAVKNFLGEKDLVKSFTSFLDSLKASGKGPGTDLPLSDRARQLVNTAALSGKSLTEDQRNELLASGELRRQTGTETRRAFEKEIFGEAQTGAARRLIDANIPEVKSNINEPSVSTLNQAINKAASLADQKRALDTQNQTSDFVNATAKLNGKMITDMAVADKLRLERETRQLDSFDDLKKASLAIEEVKNLMVEGNIVINKGVGLISDLTGFVGSMKESGWWRKIFSGGMGGW